MSDQWGPSGDGDAPAPVEPSLTLQSEQAVTTGGSRSGGRVVAGLLGVLVLLGGATFAVTQLGSSGPSSAEEAVRELLDAASDEDVLGLLAALDPGERDALRAPVEDLFGELERLEVLDDDFDLGGVAGIDLEFADVELREEAVRDDLVRVYFTGGTVTTGIRGGEMPLGGFVQDTLERFEADLTGVEESDTTEIPDDGTFLVARNGSDGWRVSIGYTAAEYARLDAGLPLPAGGLAAVGADSPEAAVEGMLRAAAELDLAGVIARLSPGEMRALHDYAPLFLDQAQRMIDSETADAGVEVSIDDLELRSDTSGDRGTVFIDAIGVTVTFEGDTVTLAMRDGCVEVSGSLVDDELEGTPFEDGRVCGEDLTEGSDDLFGFGDTLEDEGFEAPELPELPPIEAPEIGISTARVDGQWYVAPIGSFLDGAVDALGVLERAHLDAIVQFVEDFAFGFSEESFSEVGESIDGGSDNDEGFDSELGEDLGDDGETDSGSGFAPAPGTDVDIDALQGLALEAAGGDQAVADCAVGQLLGQPDQILLELIDAWEFDYEPSQTVQDAFFQALGTCGAAPEIDSAG